MPLSHQIHPTCTQGNRFRVGQMRIEPRKFGVGVLERVGGLSKLSKAIK